MASAMRPFRLTGGRAVKSTLSGPEVTMNAPKGPRGGVQGRGAQPLPWPPEA